MYIFYEVLESFTISRNFKNNLQINRVLLFIEDNFFSEFKQDILNWILLEYLSSYEATNFFLIIN